MLTIHYSNDIAQQKAILIEQLKAQPNPNPFDAEIILVQSIGIGQWLQNELCQELGISMHFHFPFQNNFFWQQIRLFYPELPEQNHYDSAILCWEIMQILPELLELDAFQVLKEYLQAERSLNQFQLAARIADLFDQYLAYRPEWLISWENDETDLLASESERFKLKQIRPEQRNNVAQHQQWQAILWKKLTEKIGHKYQSPHLHRGHLYQDYLQKLENLTEQEIARLPKRLTVFGINTLLESNVRILEKLAQYCDIHLFILNPSQFYWGDVVSSKQLNKIKLHEARKQGLNNEEAEHYFASQDLLSQWGAQGKALLKTLLQYNFNEEDHYNEAFNCSLLSQVKQHIFELNNQANFEYHPHDNSIQIHSCHSRLREVEVLHNQLLNLFEQNPNLQINDVIVMSPNIDSYTPYINAVFSQYEKQDKRFIPYSISDQTYTHLDAIISTFLQLLHLDKSDLELSTLIALLEVKAIYQKFNFTEQDIALIAQWLENSNIRASFAQNAEENWVNYTSWEQGIQRLLLGNVLGENQLWQSSDKGGNAHYYLADPQTAGIHSQLIGNLAEFIARIQQLRMQLKAKNSQAEWQACIQFILENFFAQESEHLVILEKIREISREIFNSITVANYTAEINSEIIQLLFSQAFSRLEQSANFLIGKLNFCTLIPMRSIPFKVVCLLGMNQDDFPRLDLKNHFDLMQYLPREGDRNKRNEDKYLFLESLLSAKEVFYLSYIGRNITDNAPLYPSILVTQLLEYVNKTAENLTVLEHPLQSDSPRNLIAPHFSYQEKWFGQALEKEAFFLADPPRYIALPSQITLDKLIKFVATPFKYYFEECLGVNLALEFADNNDTEHFTLDNLARYQLRQALIQTPNSEHNLKNLEKQQQLSGALPLAEFSEIAFEQCNDEVASLKEALSDLSPDHFITIPLEKSHQAGAHKLQLSGSASGYVRETAGRKTLITYSSSQSNESAVAAKIKLWLTGLLLASNKEEYDLVHYLRNQQLTLSSAKCVEHTNELTAYLDDLVVLHQGFAPVGVYELFSAQKPTRGAPQPLESLDALQSKLSEFNKDAIYLARLLAQDDRLDITPFNEKSLAWFEKMWDAIQVETL